MRHLHRHLASYTLAAVLLVLALVTGSIDAAPNLAAISFHGDPDQWLDGDLVSNSQFVLGPQAEQFHVAAYLQEIGSPLADDADLIENWCGYASVNPQVVLTLLELDGGQVSAGWRGRASRDQRDAATADWVLGLAQRFYEHIYRYGERASGTRPPASVKLPDGTSLPLSEFASSGSYAILQTLAQKLSTAQFALAAGESSSGFGATWERLFPDSDRLDASISITPDVLPPADLLQFPFPVGQRWWFNGAHNWNGSGATYGKPYSSMDFFTQADSCSAPPSGDWAVAAASGRGYHPSSASCWFRIDHEGGWTTSYYHLRNAVPSGQMSANGQIGTIACETCVGGFASGPHVHFSILYNGAYVDLEGVSLSGWAVHTGNGDYSTGSLERNGVLLKPYASVLNEGIKTTPTPTLTATPTRTVTLTASPTLTPSPTPTASQTFTPSSTPTASPTLTPSSTPTASPTFTASPTSPPTMTPSATPTGSSSATARYLYPKAQDSLRSCPVTLVADVVAPPGAQVRFLVRQGSSTVEAGRDENGADGWQTQWDCQAALDGGASLSMSVIDATGRELLHEAAQTAVIISKNCNEGTYRTAFFSNVALAGSPTSSWCKASGISYNWGTGSPGAGVPGSDNFSARFRGNWRFGGGAYRFQIQSDDGVRMWVDSVLVLNEWHAKTPTGSFELTRALASGLHEIWLEYYEATGSAAVTLSWTRTGAGGGGEGQSVFLPLLAQ